MSNAKRYVIIGAVVAVIVLIVALVAASLKKLASDEGEIFKSFVTKLWIWFKGIC